MHSIEAIPRRDAHSALERMVDRFDAAVFDVGRPRVRMRMETPAGPLADVLIDRGQARLAAASHRRADAVLRADGPTWEQMADEPGGAMRAFRAGCVRVRHDLHLGVGFLIAAAPPAAGSTRLRLRHVGTAVGKLSIAEAGRGRPVLLVHGLGATKASFLPTLGWLSRSYRTVAVDLPGFGDSVKPLGARYDPVFFAGAVTALMDALELERADIVGNSMGGRIAIELGLRHPERVRRLALLAPSLAWLRPRPWAPLLRVVPTELGLIQPAPRAIVERIVRAVVPGAHDQWTTAGIDEFLRSYLTRRGRAAFYAAARDIYMERPHGPEGFWTRLPSLRPPALFVWGHHDILVPIGFARHVRQALPHAPQLELACGHVPQLERPRETHDAIERFLADGGPDDRH